MAIKRLDKLIALNCNVSRKDARKLIKDGKVTLNGVSALKAEESVDTEKDVIAVQGYNFALKEHIYIMLHKPEGVISATEDPRKETVIDLIPPELSRKSLFPCGRLDRDTTGILIITDDGELSHKIMSPAHHVYKTYIARLKYPLLETDIEKLESGITLSDGTKCLPAKVKGYAIDDVPYGEMMIREGKYHQVKRMFAAVGNNVEHLHRKSIGSLDLDPELKAGECRELREGELEKLFTDK